MSKIVIIPFIVSMLCFASAIFSSWDLRWGAAGRTTFHRRVRISVEGRIAFGIYFGYLGVAIIAGRHWPYLWNFLMASVVPLIIGMRFIYLRDRRKHTNAPEIDPVGGSN